MSGEFSTEPNLDLAKDKKAPNTVSNSSVNKNTDTNPTNRKKSSSVTSSEIEYLKKKRKKLRLFDTAGIYNFRHIEISYLHSFWHALTLFCSVVLFYGLSIIIILEAKVTIPGVGDVSNLSVIDLLGLALTFIYPLLKIKLIITSKVSEFNKRYQLALCANAFNLVNLNYLRLLIFISALNLFILFTEDGSMRLDSAIELLFNGVLYDSLSILWWLLSVAIIVKAFQYSGKGKES